MYVIFFLVFFGEKTSEVGHLVGLDYKVIISKQALNQ